jgi:phosphoesterase RecJ-like protein
VKPSSPVQPGPRKPQFQDLCDPRDREIAGQVLHRLNGVQSILIASHERPDGDCIGSCVALCAALRAAGFSANVLNADPVPDRYQFLNQDGMVRQAKPSESYTADVLFVVDATDLNRLGKLKREQFHVKTVIDIDHHLGNPQFGDVNWVVTEASSTGELIWRLAACCGWTIPQIGLEALYTAIVTDTGQFAYANTSARVLRIAASLIESGVNPENIWRRIYLNKSQAELELESRARASLTCAAGGRICCISLKYSDFVETGTGSQHTEELASIPRSLAGVELALFMYGIDEGRQTKVSVRTMPGIDATALAKKFGGGGHRQAAGCTVPLKLDDAKVKVIAEAEALLSGH